jgi:hypothetical protein
LVTEFQKAGSDFLLDELDRTVREIERLAG